MRPAANGGKPAASAAAFTRLYWVMPSLPASSAR
jgi:hypothetical protein